MQTHAGALLAWPGMDALEAATPSGLARQLQVLATVLFWMLATCANLILALSPSLVPLPVLTNFLKRISAAWDEYGSVSRIMRKTSGVDVGSPQTRGSVSQSTIERALTQVTCS